MGFWGTEVKPGRPFTHAQKHQRLHISQATLGSGNTGRTQKSVVQCNVGNKAPVFLCTLFPNQSESCQLNVEFQELDDVIFSVIGPRSVHLTGYYLPESGSRRLHHFDDESEESYGEDIADTETERSDGDKDNVDDDYEDSFIDDDDDEPHVVDGDVVDASPKNKKTSLRRLRKKYQVCESDEEKTYQQLSEGGSSKEILDSENEDLLPISSFCKSAAKNRTLEAEENTEKEIKHTIDFDRIIPEQEADATVDAEANERQPDRQKSILHLVEGSLENGSKLNKKKKTLVNKYKEHKNAEEDDFSAGTVIKHDEAKEIETKVDQLQSTGVGSETSAKPKKKKKKKKHSKEEIQLKDGTEDISVLKMDQAQQSEKKADQSSQAIAVKNGEFQATGNKDSLLSIEVAHGIAASTRKKKKMLAKEEKGAGADNSFLGSGCREDKMELNGANSENIEKDISPSGEEFQTQANEKNASLTHDSEMLITQSGPDNCSKTKRKRKKSVDNKITEAESGNNTNVIIKDRTGQDEFKSDGLEHEKNQSISETVANQSAKENHSHKKKKRKKMSKTQEDGENMVELKHKTLETRE
ncbi:peptidyl-prolyl cis-trans isomerase FKBP43-like isoform X2 [Mercurialis annua]|uniref:peptidyl-prolyl cis-trans isomerase FKBP43-like isoform X2 n=1 Tax=Mercurialis annua TaxID=3986 RepID=UPI00215F3B7F|nr:peptidyl-prolyl cis-trans isomerase FKBP43-like isoform X2 [Mercurialis annua]